MPRGPSNFWRYHERPRPRYRKAVVSFKYDLSSINAIKKVMFEARLLASSERNIAPLYAFDPSDVVEIHTTKRDQGEGYWFRLLDGRVINHFGEIDDTNYELYTEWTDDRSQ